MMLETADWIILISLFIALSIVFYMTIKGNFPIQNTFLIAMAIVGLSMLWGIIRSDFSLLPSWIQAGATLLLLVITGMSTYAAIEMAKTNQSLVQITQNQALMQVKELKRNLIIEISRKVIQEIVSVLKREKQFLDGGYFITLFGLYQKEGKNNDIHYKTPNEIFKNHILIPDPILQKRLEQIYSLNKKFDDYSADLNLLLKRIFEKEQRFIDEFNEFCLSLPNPDKSTNLEHKDDVIFAMALSDSKSANYSGYIFFDYHREVLISKLIEAGFKQEIEEYKKIKETFFKIDMEYTTVFNNLNREWKEEYFVTDAELKSELSYMI
jgi:hypothetical protein